jgi:23S rRNA (cytosine1962-C5)-methyltransferase
MMSPMDESSIEPIGTGYELLDAGVRRRLERFGPLTIDRPAPGADGFRLAPDSWADADLRFDPGTGWSGAAAPGEPWPIAIEGLTLELRPTTSGGLGLYPEHIANLAWLAGQVADRLATGDAAPAGPPAAPRVLNLFAHTGLATLALAQAGAAVTHVDGARTTVAWARRNAELSGLADRPIRWLVDDASTFVAREARRGRRYDGIVLDPPAFGRAGRREWRLEDDLPNLLMACRAVAEDGAFVLLTAHTGTVDGHDLRDALRAALGAHGPTQVERLTIQARSGRQLEAGWAVRWTPELRPGPGFRR